MKKLITAETIRELAAAKQTEIVIRFSDTIITPEARTLASDFGISVIDELAKPVRLNNILPQISEFIPQASKVMDVKVQPEDALRAQIRAAIVAQLPLEQKNNDALIAQLIEKVMIQGGALAPVSGNTTAVSKASELNSASVFKEDRAASGVKVVKGESLKFENFAGAGQGNSVGIVDVIGAADKSPMAAGFMCWQQCFFPWKLTYDEVSFVIEGELHIKTGGETLIGKAGDVFFIPSGSEIEFGTPTNVRMLYVSYPANWAGN